MPTTVHLYGPVRMTHDGADLAVGGPRERSVLAALALAPERPVPVDRLIAWLWDDDPPPRARKSVQNAVMLLRRSLAPAGLDVERSGDAYVLRLGSAVLDTADPGAGVPLQQAGDGADVAAARARLAELRLAAVERQLAQRMAAEPDAVTSELLAWTAEHPYREPLWALLVQSHYRAGRQHEALDAYRQARETLRDGLGIEPGTALREIHRAVLAHDPALLADHATLARAWLANGAAQAALGDVPAAREALGHAVEAARSADDDLLLADAVAALCGDAQWLHGDAELEALAEESLRRLGTPARDAVRAGRLCTALALARSTRGDPRARGNAADAVALTVDASPAIRTAALFARAGTEEGPDDVDARERNGTALVEHGAATGDVVATALGRQYLSWAALERGDGAAAAAARQAMFTAAAGSPHPHLAAQVADARLLDAVVAGRLAEAHVRATEIGPAWRRSADPGFAWFLDVCARVFVHELTDGLDAMLPELGYGRSVAPSDPLWPLMTALAHGLAGRVAEANSALDAVTLSELRSFPRSTLWTGWVSGMGWLADVTDRADVAEIVLDLLRPVRARHLVLGAMHVRGAVAHWRGVCHRVLGEPDAAERQLRQALAEHEELGCPPWVALSAAALSRVLRNPVEAAELRVRAGGMAEALGMTLLAQRCANVT